VPVPNPSPSVNVGDVGVWIVTFPTTEARLAGDWSVLNQDERERADRFVREGDRALWIHTRGLLRRVLAAKLGTDPEFIAFREGSEGKPEVGAPNGGEGLQFNVSHSHAVAAIAVAPECRVGIDVERIQADLSWEPIAARFFSAAEIAFIESRPAAERRVSFFECWVRKEAYLKGLGVGLTRALDGFSVPMGSPGVTVVDPTAEPSGGARSSWSVHPIDVPDGYAAALVVDASARLAPPRP
jgi:4'-phosphopantetheinyl transferase